MRVCLSFACHLARGPAVLPSFSFLFTQSLGIGHPDTEQCSQHPPLLARPSCMSAQNKRGLVIKCSHFQPAELPEANLEDDDTADFDFKPRPRRRPFRRAPCPLPTSPLTRSPSPSLLPLPSSLADAPSAPCPLVASSVSIPATARVTFKPVRAPFDSVRRLLPRQRWIESGCPVTASNTAT